MRTYTLKKAVITVLDHETLSVVSIDVQVKSDKKKKCLLIWQHKY